MEVVSNNNIIIASKWKINNKNFYMNINKQNSNYGIKPIERSCKKPSI